MYRLKRFPSILATNANYFLSHVLVFCSAAVDMSTRSLILSAASVAIHMQ
jgi:hypothetical protein